ncbi:MAG: glycoside hydrolase family 127 protein [Ruminococcaceae bacterium]|nr:glycoside hydrolase family 127 protein [Oscillospiraceae bacterium]
MKSCKKTDYRAVELTGGFWKAKEDLNRDVTMQAVYDRFTESGRIDAFRCDWKEGMDKQPHFFWDSDVVKWMEGAAYCLSRKADAELEKKVEDLIDLIEKNRDENGYFNIYFTVVEPEGRFTKRGHHELYCAGHMMEAAVAYYEATGKRRFLDIAEKYAGYIKSAFMDGTADVKPRFVTPGHQEIELALLRMYRATDNIDWLELAKFFLDSRGANEIEALGRDQYTQSWLPVREQHEAVGHSVRAGYLYTAMADLAFETDDEELKAACRHIWDDIVSAKMYVTGGVGAVPSGEQYGEKFYLPNESSYNETCASISMMLFAHRMNKMELHAKYADVVELEMYNGMMVGLSLSGDAFFYQNVLELEINDLGAGGGKHTTAKRAKIFECSCCPPNLNRTLSSMGQYFYMWDEGDVWVNQFGDSVLSDGGIKVTQKTDYPRSGKVEITADGVRNLRVRVPGWCKSFTASREYVMENGYAVFAGEGEVTVDFGMKPTFIKADDRVRADRGKVCVKYGPVVYCAEGIDNDGALRNLYFDPANPEWEIEACDKCGCMKLSVNGWRKTEAAGDELYSELDAKFEPTRIKLVPYHIFGNREICDMSVYLLYR